ncbi:TPA: hypothetical protein N0F65_012948 [Lagenidium giganteum]|uniref:Uncharacterized protein n=1 Tax=Lagenidium giganteum TaxID=4803 RepID=A0AAV2Z4R0_9STRA|nr:TPA: hypothetical protein N0F65_012948 [Lagenidium giganteum]
MTFTLRYFIAPLLPTRATTKLQTDPLNHRLARKLPTSHMSQRLNLDHLLSCKHALKQVGTHIPCGFYSNKKR